jgi:hypothetical protein
VADWASARIRPPKRDLVELRRTEAVDGCQERSGGPPPGAELLHLYELW